MKIQPYDYNQNVAIKNIMNLHSYLNTNLFTGSKVLEWMRSYKKFIANFPFTQEGTELLIEALKSSPKFFKKIDFTGQSFSNDHANIIFQLLRYNSSLQFLSLDLNKQKLDDTFLESLIQLISNNLSIEGIELKLPAMDTQVERIFETLSTMSKLRNIHLEFESSDSSTFKSLMPHIYRITSLKKLDLSYNKFDPEETTALMDLVEKMTSLNSLNISGCSLDIDAIKNFALSTEKINLKSLDMSNWNTNNQQVVEFMPLLSKMIKLQELDISYNQLNFSAVQTLVPLLNKMTNLQKLDISHCHLNRNSVGMMTSSVDTITNLQELNLGFNNFNLDTIELFIPALNNMIKLQNLIAYNNHINNSIITSFVPTLSKMIGLESLNLFANDLDCDAIKKLAPCISNMNNLRKLNLSYNALNNEAIKILVCNVSKMTALKNLNLSNNQTDTHTFEILSVLIHNSKSLIKLDTQSQYLYFPQMIEFFSNNDTLAILAINLVDFTGSIESITEMVNKNFSLTFLDLRECMKGQYSVLLEYMIIRNNLIQDDAKEITELLNKNYEQQYNHKDSNKMLKVFLNLDCPRKVEMLQYTQLTSKPALKHLLQKDGSSGELWLARLEGMISTQFFYLKRVCKKFEVEKDANESIHIPETILELIVFFLGKRSLSHDIDMSIPEKFLVGEYTPVTQEFSDPEGTDAAEVNIFISTNFNNQNLTGDGAMENSDFN